MRLELAKRIGCGETIGLLCVAATVALLSPGVQIVRAESPAGQRMSIDPVLVEVLEEAVTMAPEPVLAPVEHGTMKPGRPAVERAPGVIVLNTRGYNYGPPDGEVDPRAVRFEGGVSPPSAVR